MKVLAASTVAAYVVSVLLASSPGAVVLVEGSKARAAADDSTTATVLAVRDLKGKGRSSKSKGSRDTLSEEDLVNQAVKNVYRQYTIDELKQGYENNKRILEVLRSDPDKYLTDDLKSAMTIGGVYYAPDNPLYDKELAGLKALSDGSREYKKWLKKNVGVEQPATRRERRRLAICRRTPGCLERRRERNEANQTGKKVGCGVGLTGGVVLCGVGAVLTFGIAVGICAPALAVGVSVCFTDTRGLPPVTPSPTVNTPAPTPSPTETCPAECETCPLRCVGA